MSILLFVVGILLFISLVVVHEWGHFIMARRNGVGVEEFGIFFPPRLFKHRTRGGWDFTINLLPLGGFVKLKGEHDTDTEKGSYGAAPLWAKTKIMAAGVVMNLIVAVVLLMIVALVGMPQLVDNQFTVKSDTHVTRSEVIVSYVEPGSPAAKAGLKNTDRIESIGTKTTAAQTNTPDKLRAATKRFAGKQVTITYVRAGEQHKTTTTLLTNQVVAASDKTSDPKGQLGVVPTAFSLQRSTWSAPIVAVGLTGQFTALTFEGLGKAVAGVGSIVAGAITGNTHARQNGQETASSQVSGPVGIFVILQDGSLLGYQFMLMIIAIISLTLAIMNILPIPALDGGRLWFTLFARGVRGRPLTARREELINGIGFLFLIGLIILITVVDVHRFF